VISLLFCALAAVEPGSEPLPPLPPTPAPLQVDVEPSRARPEDPRRIGDDLLQLREAIERVTRTLEPAQGVAAGGAASGDVPSTVTAAGETIVRRWPRFGLVVTRHANGDQRVSADFHQQRLEAVYRDLGTLLDRPIDDAGITITQRLVTLQVTDLPWDEALDRLFGQVGIFWQEVGTGSTAKLVLREHLDASQRERLHELRADRARRVLLRASSGSSQAYAAEALFRIAEQEAQAGRYLDAIRGYSRLVVDFDDGRDPGVAVWVMQGIRGIAEAMVAAGQPAEALGVFRSYITRAEPGDAQLPGVYLGAARAALEQAKRSNDPRAREEAGLLLGVLVERFADRSDATAAVAEARIALGELLLNAGRYAEAEEHLAAHVRTTRHEDERIAFWRAECQFQLGRLEDARTRYERVAASDSGLVTLDQRARAAVRIGECLLKERPPQYARALFAFLRARQDWPRLRLDGEVMVAVARCYAELEHEEGAIEEFWQLLRGTTLDDQAARDRLGQFLGGLQGSLTGYDATVRARVLFHIAEADHRQAWRDHLRRPQLVADAIQRYDRVLKENPPADLRNAARLGLARVAFLGDEHTMGRQALHELFRDPESTDRERQLAAQTLGDHLKAKGLLREAIAAYEGHVP